MGLPNSAAVPGGSESIPMNDAPLRIGLACYPSVGGSGILATSLGVELARRGHEVHFVCYERPFRLPADQPGVTYHPVHIQGYGLFRHPDYSLPLAVKLAEVARERRLQVLHAHYAVPHATAAVLARDWLPEDIRPAVVATLHGTDTTLLGRDPGYAPAIRHDPPVPRRRPRVRSRPSGRPERLRKGRGIQEGRRRIDRRDHHRPNPAGPSQTNYVQAVYNFHTADARLARALGQADRLAAK